MSKRRKKVGVKDVLAALTAAGTFSVGSVLVSSPNVDFATYQELQAYAEVMTYEHQLEGSPEYKDIKGFDNLVESMEDRFLNRKMPDSELKPLGQRRSEYLEKRNRVLNR